MGRLRKVHQSLILPLRSSALPPFSILYLRKSDGQAGLATLGWNVVVSLKYLLSLVSLKLQTLALGKCFDQSLPESGQRDSAEYFANLGEFQPGFG